MTDKPLISVIIPTYNRAGLLSEAISSVARQTCPDWELIVVDDGSTDGTRSAVATTFAQIGRPDKCHYFYQKNRGVSGARNYGVRQARGEYLTFLDSDDLWQPDKLEQQVKFLENNQSASAVYTNETWWRGRDRLNQKKRHRKYSGWIFPACLDLCLISASSILLKRAVFDKIGPFDETFPVCEDYEMWLRLTRDFPVYLIDQPLIIKRTISSDQLSTRYPAMDRFRVRALEKILTGQLTASQRRLVRQNLAWRCRLLAQGALKRGKFLTCFSYSGKAKIYAK